MISTNNKPQSKGGRKRVRLPLPPIPIPPALYPFNVQKGPPPVDNTKPPVTEASLMGQFQKCDGHLNCTWLWLGALATAQDLMFCENEHIQRILSMGEDAKLDPDIRSQKILHIDIGDHCDAPIGTYFIEMFTFLYASEITSAPTLVHCRGGISRSPTAVIAYLMARDPDHSMQRASDHVRSCRPKINPNLIFVVTLQKFEYELKNTHPNIAWTPDALCPVQKVAKKIMCTKCGKEVEGSVEEHFEQRHKKLPPLP